MIEDDDVTPIFLPPGAQHTIERDCLDAVAQLEGRWCDGCQAERPCLCDIEDARLEALLDRALDWRDG